MSNINSAGLFLIQLVFDLYIFILLLRFLLQVVYADYFNPIVQFVVKCTQILVKPLPAIFPRYKNIDARILLLMLVFEGIKLSLLFVLAHNSAPSIVGILLWTIGNLLGKLCGFYFYIIIIRAILSWFSPTHYSPAYTILYQLTEPLLMPIRRFLPLMGSFDLSPLLLIILLQLLLIFIVGPIVAAGIFYSA